jgi:putative DNA primase/helicase
MPGTFVLDLQGVQIVEKPDSGPEKRTLVLPTQCFVVGRSKSLASNEETVTLIYWERGRWHTITANRADTAQPRTLIQSTAGRGLPVDSHFASMTVQYLTWFIVSNVDTIPVDLITDSMGWNPVKKLSFLAGKRQIAAPGAESVTFQPADSGDAQIANSFHERGSYQAWTEAVASVIHYPHVQVALYGAFLAPLLKILKIPNVIIDFSGRTSTGKTTLLMVGASTCGCPDISNPDSCITSADSTIVGLERRCSVACDLPGFVDDTKRADERRIEQMVYTINQGRGRSRGSKQGMRETPSFRTVVETTGEQTITSYGESGGTRTRVVPITGPPFGAETDATREIVTNLTRALQMNYGHALPMFIERLISTQDRHDEYRAMFEEQRTHYATNSGGSNRLADSAAAIATAGRIACELLQFPWTFEDPFDVLWPGILAMTEDVHAHVRARRYIYDAAVSQQGQFFGHHEETIVDGKRISARPPGGWHGVWSDASDWPYIGIIHKTLKQWLTQGGFDADAVIDEWAREGWLRTGRDGQTLPAKLDGKTSRVIALTRESISSMLGGCRT